jgi:hypothetical protein
METAAVPGVVAVSPPNIRSDAVSGASSAVAVKNRSGSASL